MGLYLTLPYLVYPYASPTLQAWDFTFTLFTLMLHLQTWDFTLPYLTLFTPMLHLHYKHGTLPYLTLPYLVYPYAAPTNMGLCLTLPYLVYNNYCIHFAVSLAAVCIRQNGALGSRLTGAGWGGCVVSLVPAEKLQSFVSSVSVGYYSEPSRAPVISECLFASEPGDGAALFVF